MNRVKSLTSHKNGLKVYVRSLHLLMTWTKLLDLLMHLILLLPITRLMIYRKAWLSTSLNLMKTIQITLVSQSY